MREFVEKPAATISFNRVSGDLCCDGTDNSLTFAVRTDANYAIGGIRQKIIDSFHQNAVSMGVASNDVKSVLDAAYAEWGRSVISALALSMDYQNYGLPNDEPKNLQIHLHDAKFLSRQVVEHARTYMADTKKENVIYVSLDEMITGEGADWSDVGFSRKFSHDGRQQGEFVGRPGKQPLGEQIQELKRQLIESNLQTGGRSSFVLLEDNVRHARTINWIINEMDKAGVFEHGDIAAISTCFCCASEEEQQKIQYKGEVVPLLSVVEYQNVKVDVITPRDLLFDGYVVEIEGGLSRLPGLFMDVEKMFKVRPERADEFKYDVGRACVKFCDDVYSHTGYNLRVQDLVPGPAMCEILGCEPTDLVSDVIFAHAVTGSKVDPNIDRGIEPVFS